MAARNPAFRYEEQDKVQSWVNSQNFEQDQLGKLVKGAEARRPNSRQLYNTAMTLANDECIEPCRVTGTSWLNTMGLNRSQLNTTMPSAKHMQPVLGGRGLAGACGKASTLTMGVTGQQTPANAEFTLGAKQPVLGNFEDDGESIHSICTHSSHEAAQSSRMGSKKKLKSGMYDRVADDVVMKLKWLHKKLSKSWVPERLQMHQLSFKQVVAGEIAIITRSTNPEEVRCRLHILQKLAYWNMQGQGWPRVRDIYCAILHSIEEGEANWQSTF